MAYFVQSDSGRMRSDPRCAMLAGTCRSKVSSDRKEGKVTECTERAHDDFNPSFVAWTPPTGYHDPPKF